MQLMSLQGTRWRPLRSSTIKPQQLQARADQHQAISNIRRSCFDRARTYIRGVFCSVRLLLAVETRDARHKHDVHRQGRCKVTPQLSTRSFGGQRAFSSPRRNSDPGEGNEECFTDTHAHAEVLPVPARCSRNTQGHMSSPTTGCLPYSRGGRQTTILSEAVGSAVD